MKDKTAVEWLVEQIDNKDMGEIPMWIYDFIEQAKELEKQQIIDAADWNVTELQLHDGEQYYNETFKSE
jgi:hypothetical protein